MLHFALDMLRMLLYRNIIIWEILDITNTDQMI